MEKKGSGMREFLNRTSLPELELPGQPLVEICGTYRVLVEGHRGVKEYGKERICVAVRGGVVVIRGEKLELRCMSRLRLVITGVIHGVILPGRGCNGEI